MPVYLPRIHLTRQDAAVRVAVLVGGTVLREVTPAAPYRGRCRDCRVSARWSPSWSPGQCRLRPCRQRISVPAHSMTKIRYRVPCHGSDHRTSLEAATASRMRQRNWSRRRVAGREPARILRVHNYGYTEDMDVSQNQLSVRDARAHFAELITRAQGGTPTIITRNGQPVAAIVPIEDFNALEDAIDRYFAREADRDIAENPDAPTYSMSEVVAAIFEEETGKGVA